AWRLDGKPRTARRFTVYQNCPLLTPEDRLLFILAYLKTYPLQVVHGRVFGMVQGKANRWIHVLLPVLLAALRALGRIGKSNGIFAPVSAEAHPRHPAVWTLQRLCIQLPALAGQRAGEVRGASPGCSGGPGLGMAPGGMQGRADGTWECPGSTRPAPM